jgi:hypothetical protein
MHSDIVALMDPGQSEPVRVSRGVRNLLAVVGVLLLVPSLAVVAWAVLNHAEPLGLITIVPGGLLLGDSDRVRDPRRKIVLAGSTTQA